MPTAKKQRDKRIKQGNKTPKSKGTTPRPVVYDKPKSTFCVGDKAITADKAKDLLGWQEEEDKTPFGSKFLLKCNGKKVRCNNNVANRPLYPVVVATLKQEHLRKRWRVNGEPLIIGETGLILNGQHSLISLIHAAIAWVENPDAYPEWESEPTMQKLVVYGVAEDDETINTMDTCKPRSLMDVIYRARYFKQLPVQAQRLAARMAEHAVKMMWHRTNTHSDAFAPKRTHSESIDYLQHHPRLLKAVLHIYEEDEGKIRKYLSPGYASALLYLMATCDSDPTEYYTTATPEEKSLDFGTWEKACEFFVELAAGSQKFKPLRDAIGKLMEEGNAGAMEKWVVFVKAWNNYQTKGKLPPANKLYPEFVVKDGEQRLAEQPLLGGIDVGDNGPDFSVADEKEVTKEVEKARKKRAPKVQVASRKESKWHKGDTAWVHANGEDAYYATLKNNPYDCADGTVKVQVDAEDGEWEEDVTTLSLAQFEMK